MHSKLDRLENNKDFIDWLKEQGCSSEIINGILKFDNFSAFKKRAAKQPDLLTALVKNGYDSKVVNTAFCYGNDQMYDDFLRYKPFVLELLKNQCPAESLNLLYCINGYLFNKRLITYGEVYITILKYFPCSINYQGTFQYMVDCKESKLKNCMSNLKLFRLLMINGIQGIGIMSGMVVQNNMGELPNDTLGNLLNRNDFTKITVNDNKELLDFLLNNQLITFNEDKLNFIRDYSLVFSLLKKDDFTIENLKSKSIKEIQEKIKKLSQEKILKADPTLEQVGQDVDINYDNKNRVQLLKTYAMAVIVENIQENKLPNPSLSSVETTCAETSKCVIS